MLVGAFVAIFTAFIPAMHAKAFVPFYILEDLGVYKYDEALEQINEYGGWQCTKSIFYNEDGTYDTIEHEYDRFGNETKRVYYKADGSPDDDYRIEMKNEYDIDNNLIKTTWINAGTLRDSYEYEYNNGKKIKETYYNSDGSVGNWTEYEYNSGKRIKETSYNSDGSVGRSVEYYYNSNGDLIKEKIISGFDVYYIDYEYDQYGKRTKSTHHSDSGYTITEYDNTRQTKSISYTTDGKTTGYYEYDEFGNLIFSGDYDENAKLSIRTDNKYDDEKRITTVTSYTEDGNVNTVLEYNEYGNRISYISYNSDGSIQYNIKHEWTYFPGKHSNESSTGDGNLTVKINTLPDDGSITVDYSDNAEVSADVFTTIAGTNKDVTFTSEGISWEFSGSDIDASAAKKIDLSTTVTMINKQDQNTASAIENLFGQERNALVLKFADNGKLPGKAKIRINADEALKQYLGTTGLEVFYWDSENNTLVPIASKVSIDENNQIVFEIDHCSYYVVKGRETTKEDKHIPEDVNKDVPEGYEMLFRLYNPNSGEHFYTKSKKEGNSLIDLGWNYEGEGWTAPISGTPVYRLYNKNAGDHHYTTSEREKNKLVATGWEYEGIGWYSETAENGKPLYRLYNPNATGAGSHHYTTSTRERDSLIKQGWNDEDIAWYGLKK